MENPEDDPREFQHAHDGFGDDALPPDMDGFLGMLHRFRGGPRILIPTERDYAHC